ncbi:MAG: hypothetical protein WC243_03545 [Patescibacteria group bacterium]|jgi:hypothetical protein
MGAKLKNLILNSKNVILIFFIAFAGYLINLPTDYSKTMSTRTYRRLLTSYDVTAATFLPYELITKGNLFFSIETLEGMRRTEGPTVHSVMKVGDRYFSAYPILSGVMAVPIYLIPVILHKIPDLHYVENLTRILSLARISASFYTAISVSVFYLILTEIDKLKKFRTTKWIYLFVFFYAFGTNAYAVASRSLWQHTSSLLFVSIIILFLLKSIKNERYIKWLGLLAGLLYLARPLNIVFIFILTIYVFIKHRKQFPSYLLFSLPCVVLLLAYNQSVFGKLLTSEYVVKGDTKFSTPILKGLSGNLFSPARSFIFITPPLAVSFYSMVRVMITKKKTPLDIILTVLSITFIIMFVLYSKWWCWYGADRFGYGLFTEWLPIVSVFTYLAFKPSGRIIKIVFLILVLWSLYAQFNAVWFRKSRCSGDSHNWTFYCLKPLMFTDQEY